MKFLRFKIKNYKGIQDVTLDMSPNGGNIFTLVGLNESGKTSILEAISRFNPAMTEDGDEIKQLYSTVVEKIDPATFIPKHLKSNFNGDVIIEAVISLDDSDKSRILDKLNNNPKFEHEISELSDKIIISQNFIFESSNFNKRQIYVTYSFSVKRKGSRAKVKRTTLFDETLMPRKEHDLIYKEIKALIPSIYYFPTFIFNQPEKINISENNQDVIHRIYAKVLDNIAYSTNNRLNLENHIIDRVFSEDSSVREALQSSLDQMSELITRKVFDLWGNILQTKVIDKEIVLVLTTERDNIYIQFQIKQGASRFSFNERSLGFRWFFSFLLFTLFNKKDNDKNILFLLDEPAANLHAKAQEELLSSFPQVINNSNQIIYSTHSHYLINPIWLDQAYIVSNKAINYDYLDDREGINNGNTLIHLDKYRNYVSSNPTKTTYFQPILDKLQVTPSMLDCIKPSVLVEGKSDYLILEYARKVLLEVNDNIGILPLGGATTCEALISILKGWGVPFFIMFDDDSEGRNMLKRVKRDYLLSDSSALTLNYFDDSLSGKEISGLLSDTDIEMISSYFSSPNQVSPRNIKSSIQLFFSEHLASGKKVQFSEEFMRKIILINDKITEYFD